MSFLSYSAAADPRWSSPDHDQIDLVVVFDHWPVPLPFTARPDDEAGPHGAEIFSRAVAGEFGPIAPYVAPPPVVPASVSRVQGKIALQRRGLYDAASVAVSSRGLEAEIWWIDEIRWTRESSYLKNLAADLNIDLDGFLIEAADIA